MIRLPIALALAGALACRAHAQAATPVTRAQAVQSAIERGPRLGIAGADTAVAAAQILIARTKPNPSLTTELTKSAPQFHLTVDLPLDYASQRRARIGSAEAVQRTNRMRYASEQMLVALDADTTYTRAAAAVARLGLAQRNVRDADSLLHMVTRRRDAGDASDLDVAIATLTAGQEANAAAGDSLDAALALLDLQRVMGLTTRDVTVVPVDSLIAPFPLNAPPSSSTYPVAVAEASLNAAELGITLQRRSIFGMPSVTFGFERHDPAGDERGILPVIGFSIPLPFWDRNRGGIALAEAERARARAELAFARIESAAEIARATRLRDNALSRVTRDRELLTTAEGVTGKLLTAYREGAATLPNILEAQRTARDIQAGYIDDLAAAWIATATLRVLTLTPASAPR